MRVWGLLPLCGCVWISEAELEGRRDVDGDGVPSGFDCNDDVATVVGLEAVGEDLQCGDAISGLRFEDDVLEGTAMPCADPLRPGRTVELVGGKIVRRFRQDEPAVVSVSVVAGPSQFRDEGRVSILANEGARCTSDSCVLGFPWPATDESATVEFAAGAGEAWYIIVAGGQLDAEYALQVSCD